MKDTKNLLNQVLQMKNLIYNKTRQRVEMLFDRFLRKPKSLDKPKNVDLILKKMQKFAHKFNIPIIGEVEGSLLGIFVEKKKDIKYILDIGTSIGYSAICLAKSLRYDQKVISIDMDINRVIRAKDFIKQVGLQDKIEVICGDVFDILPTLDIKFDIIFQDVMKHKYFAKDIDLASNLFYIILDHLEVAGLLIVDNVFCSDKVYEGDHSFIHIEGMRRFNDLMISHPSLSSIIFTLCDGLWVSVKKI